MITKEEYLKAKAIVDEYEQNEFVQGTLESMYCVPCQALEPHQCFCDEERYDYDDFMDEEDELGADCVCGAWQRNKSGVLVHLADCCCGRE